MIKPIIGIVVCGFENERQFVSQNYIHAVEQSGGVPIILPCIEESESFSRYISICSGFLFCGGDDITPFLLGEEPVTNTLVTDMETDRFQLSFMRYILDFDKPLLAICRGMQILNAVLGGTIWQDLSLSSKTLLCHMQNTRKRSDICHKVYFKKDSMLFNIFGESADTNSYHHQAVQTPGKGLIVCGTSSDLVIEAVESPSRMFTAGVQWHPESMPGSDKMTRLFTSFISACTKFL